MRGLLWSQLALCALVAILMLPTGCGTSGTGGRRIVALVGGSIPPNPCAYRITPSTDIVVPGSNRTDLPDSIDLRRDGVVPPVQNQRFNSCVGWTLGYYVMTALEARKQHRAGHWLDLTKQANCFSPDFIYSQRDTLDQRTAILARRTAGGEADTHAVSDGICFESDGEIGCMRPERALEVLMRHGCCRWPWLCSSNGDDRFRPCGDGTSIEGRPSSRLPWYTTVTHAGYYRPLCYVRFGNLGELETGTVNRVQAWLHDQGTPVAAVVNMTSGWVTYQGENPLPLAQDPLAACGGVTERPVCLDAGGESLGGQHMMAIIGYDRNFPTAEQVPGLPVDLQGSFLVVNQWGDKWGDDGFMWIPCAELKKIWVAGYGVVGSDQVVWQRARGADDTVCVQNADGTFLNVSRDGNDTPVNLLRVSEWEDLQVDRVVEGTGEQVPGCPTAPTDPMGLDDIDVSPGAPGLDPISQFAGCYDEADPDRLLAYVTAVRMVLPVAGGTDVTSHRCEVGGKPRKMDDSPTVRSGGMQDTQDWFWFVVPPVAGAGPDGGHHEVELGVELTACDWSGPAMPPAPAGSKLGLRLVDNNYEQIGQTDGSTLTTTARLAPGSYFVRVSPLAGPTAEDVTYYRLSLRVLSTSQDPAGDGGAMGGPSGLDPSTLRCKTTFAQSLADRRLYRLQSWQGRTVRAHLHGLDPGDSVQLIVAAFDRGTRHLRTVHSRVVGSDGGEIRISMPRPQHVLATSIPADQGRGTLYVGLRNLGGSPADVTLDVEEYGRWDPSDPFAALACTTRVEEIGAGAPGPDIVDPARGVVVWRFGTEDAFPVRTAGEVQEHGLREAILQVRAPCMDAQLVFTDDTGTGIPGLSTGELAPVPRHAGGALHKRIVPPTAFQDTVWVTLRDGAAPMRTFDLHRLRERNLAYWPRPDAINTGHGLDEENVEDNAPGSARVFSVSDIEAGEIVHGDACGHYPAPDDGLLSAWDFWDFYRIHNDTEEAAVVRVEIVRSTGLANLYATHWAPGTIASAGFVGCSQAEVHTFSGAPFAFCKMSLNAAAPPYVVDLEIPAGASRILMVESFSSAAESYSVRVRIP